jgi:proline iminopeptidase
MKLGNVMQKFEIARQADLSPGSHALDVLGVRQSYHVAGTGPICVVHPGGPGIEWTYIRMPALEEHLTMLYVEPIGTGASGRLPLHPNGYTVERFNEQLGALLDALSLTSVLILGHSHGGFVAQRYALTHPDRISGLILYSSAAVTGSEFMASASQNIMQYCERYANDPISQDVLAAWQALGAMRSDEDYTFVLRRLLPAYFADYRRPVIGFGNLRAELRATLLIGDNKGIDFREALPDLPVPVLVMAGEHDFICGTQHGERIASLASRGRLARFMNSGHFIHLEEPAAFSAAIFNFLNVDCA